MSIESEPAHHWAKVVEDGTLEIRVGPIAQSCCLVQLVGELDLATVGAAEKELGLVERAGPGTVVLDFSELEFIDSSGIKLLMDARDRARVNGQALRLIRGPKAVQRVLELCGLTDWLRFLDDTEAVSLLGRTPG
jgi:anti-anti-sigma factor